jgi:hypothetical protein
MKTNKYLQYLFIQLKANVKFPVNRIFIQLKGGKNEKRK